MTSLKERSVRISLLMALTGSMSGIESDTPTEKVPDAYPITESMVTDVRSLLDEEQGHELSCDENVAAYRAMLLTRNLANAYNHEDQYLQFLHETREELEADGCTRSEAYVQTLVNIASIYKERGIEGRISALPQIDFSGRGSTLAARIRPGRATGATPNLLEARTWYERACAAMEGQEITPNVAFFALYGLGHTEELLHDYAHAEELMHRAITVLPKDHDDDYDYLVRERLANIDDILTPDEE